MASPEQKQEGSRSMPVQSTPKVEESLGALTFPEARLSVPDIASKTDRDLVKMLDSEKYLIRQAAIKELSERPLDKQLLAEVLPTLSNNAAKAFIEIATDKEFSQAHKSFTALYDRTSIAELEQVKIAVKEFRFANRSAKLEGELATDATTLIEKGKFIEDFKLAETQDRIVTSLTEKYGLVNPNDVKLISIYIQSLVRNIVTPEEKAIVGTALADIAKIPWESYRLDRTMIKLDRIADELFAAPARMSRDEMGKFSNGLGLDVLTAKSSFHTVERNDPLELSSREGIVKAYRENLDELRELLKSPSPDPSILKEKANLVNLNHDFLELTDVIVSKFYDSSQSKVLQPMIEKWNTAMAKGNIEEMEKILNDNSILARIPMLSNTKDVGPLDCLFVDNILYNQELDYQQKVEWSEVTNDVQLGLNLFLLQDHESIQASVKALIGDTDAIIKDAYSNMDIKPLIELKEKLDLYHFAANNYLDLSDDLKNNVMLHPTLKQAAIEYLGNSINKSKSHLQDFLEKEVNKKTLLGILELGRAGIENLGISLPTLSQSNVVQNEPENAIKNDNSLDGLLDRFRSEFVSIKSINRVYVSLNDIENNDSYSPIQRSLASDARTQILDALLSKDRKAVDQAFDNGNKLVWDIEATRQIP
jgi:hypothetical protein